MGAVRLSAGTATADPMRRGSITMWSAATVVSTDPPYYDNIGYADLSDFFYVVASTLPE